MTKLEKATVKAIREWCKGEGIKPVKSLCHIYPRVYVLGRPTSSCLLIACPPVDSEPQIKKSQKIFKGDGTHLIHKFDDSLKSGDWCSVAYVCTDYTQESIAVLAVE